MDKNFIVFCFVFNAVQDNYIFLFNYILKEKKITILTAQWTGHMTPYIMSANLSMTLVMYLYMESTWKTISEEHQNLWAIFERFFKAAVFPSPLFYCHI